MAETDEQTKRDALFLLETLKHTKVIVNAGEIALHKDVNINTIETRLSAIKKRHNLKISTTTKGFTKQKPSTPKKLVVGPRVKAIEGPDSDGHRARPTRTPKLSAKKRQAEQDGWLEHGDDEPSPAKQYRFDGDEVTAVWGGTAGEYYDSIVVLDGARSHAF